MSRHRREILLVIAILLLAGVLAIVAPGFFRPGKLPALPDHDGSIAGVLAKGEASQGRILPLALGTEYPE